MSETGAGECSPLIFMNPSFVLAVMADRQQCNIYLWSCKLFECWKMHRFSLIGAQISLWRMRFDTSTQTGGFVSRRQWGSAHVLTLIWLYLSCSACVGRLCLSGSRLVYKTWNVSRKTKSPKQECLKNICLKTKTLDPHGSRSPCPVLIDCFLGQS